MQEEKENEVNLESNQDLKKLMEEIDSKKAEIEEKDDRLKRLMAEFDNFKKRSQKERDVLYNSLVSEIFQSLLPVIDNLEKAVSAKTEDAGYKQGVEMVLKQFQDVLNANGIKEIESVGKTFNPELHEAIGTVTDESLGEKEIKEEYRKGYIIGDKVIPACNTTPESMTIQEYFAEMVQSGCDSVVMEVSSQGLMLHRTAGIQFEIGIFTNLEPDHIGPAEHSSFEEYLECKSRLFRQCKLGIMNADDKHLEEILKGHTCQVETYGFAENADFRATDTRLVSAPGYLGIDYYVSGKRNFQVEIDIPGKFSVYNSLAAIAVCNHFGVTDENIVSALRQAKVKGRIEMIKVSDDFTLMIDYAHNAMALESLLTTLKEYHPKRLVCLFGCGGNRSKSRRFEMGEVSGKLADFTIITSDNPRFEEPEAILADIESAISKTEGKYIKITDRKDAIAYAIHHGQPGDVIVLAGKGHEDYQEICGVKHPMDERVLIKEILEEDAAKAIR